MAVGEDFDMQDTKPQYIGDSVYVEIKGGMVRLWTSNGIVTLNEIFMEEEVLQEFLNFVEDNAV